MTDAEYLYEYFVNRWLPYFGELDTYQRSMLETMLKQKNKFENPAAKIRGVRITHFELDEWYPHPPIRYRDGGWNVDLDKLKSDEEYQDGLKSMILFRLELQSELRRGLQEEIDKQILWGDGYGNQELRGIS